MRMECGGGPWLPPLLFVIPAKRLQPLQKLAEVQGLALGGRKVAAGVVAMLFGNVTGAEDRRQLSWNLNGHAHGNFPLKHRGSLYPARRLVK